MHKSSSMIIFSVHINQLFCTEFLEIENNISSQNKKGKSKHKSNIPGDQHVLSQLNNINLLYLNNISQIYEHT